MTDQMHRLPDSERIKQLSTDELRAAFLVPDLFKSGQIVLRHVDLDRVVLGGAVPLDTPLVLEPPASLGATFFTERRELGVLNIGSRGSISTDDSSHCLDSRDVLYIGRGTRRIEFASDDLWNPARFYLVSYPAHASHPTVLVKREDAESAELGTQEGANRRRLSRYIHARGAASAQLVMGVTELLPGCVWNTMPSHTHQRRTEVYLYFGLGADAVVVHMLGEPNETRHVVVRDGEVVLSPIWSVHTGCGTSRYAFCWAMGGENQDFADMQAVDMRELK